MTHEDSPIGISIPYTETPTLESISNAPTDVNEEFNNRPAILGATTAPTKVKIKDMLSESAKQHNGKGLSEKVGLITASQMDIINEMKKIDLDGTKAKVSDNYQKLFDSMETYKQSCINNDKWNKFYRNWRFLLIIIIIFIIALAVIMLMDDINVIEIVDQGRTAIYSLLGTGMTLVVGTYSALSVKISLSNKQETSPDKK